VEIMNRLGTLLTDTLRDLEGGQAQFAQVLAMQPGQPQAVAALERLMSQAPDPRGEVGRLLEEAYEHTGRYDKLVALLTERLAHVTDEHALQALRLRLAEINASKLGDAAGAYGQLVEWIGEAAVIEAHLLKLRITALPEGYEIWGLITQEEDWREGEREWHRLSWAAVDNCQIRYRIVENEAVR
jgi:lipopolysaccharide biosynthesis regulator YciM